MNWRLKHVQPAKKEIDNKALIKKPQENGAKQVCLRWAATHQADATQPGMAATTTGRSAVGNSTTEDSKNTAADHDHTDVA